MFNVFLFPPQDAVRVSKKDYESQRAKMYGAVDLWHHVDCFVENRDDLGFETGMNTSKSVHSVAIKLILYSYCYKSL